jgi:DNA repair protein RadD
MMLTASQDLIGQNHDKLVKVWPNAPVGIFSAGLNKRQTNYPITYAGIDSAVGKHDKFGHIDIIMVDECDLVPDDMKSNYRKFLAAMQKQNPCLRIIGLTATDWRTGTGRITQSDNALFTDVCVDMCSMEAYNWFVSEGYLVPLVSKPTTIYLDTSGVGVVAGEYNKAQLERAVNKRDITEGAFREALAVTQGTRRKWLVFCSGVAHCIEAAEVLNYLGIEARSVHSKNKEARIDNLKWFREYDGQEPIAVTNNDVLTVGYDDPSVDLIIVLRPTKSSRLWVQMLGRGTRPVYADGFDLETTEGRLQAIHTGPKQNTMVLDFARNILSMGPINDPVIPKKKGKGGPAPAPVKECLCCGEYNHASVRVCGQKDALGNQIWGCGSEFPETIKIEATASQQNIQRESVVPIVETFKVDMVNYMVHVAKSTAPTLRVSYYCGTSKYDDYVCVQHPDGWAKKKANKWWRGRTIDKDTPMPDTVAQAMEWVKHLRTPTHISVITNQKWPTITDYCFDGTNFGREPITNPAQLRAPQVHVQRPSSHNTAIPKRHPTTFDEDMEAHNVH